MLLSTLADCSAGEEFFVPSGLQLLPCFLLCVRLLRQKPRESTGRQCQRPTSSGHWKQSLTSQYNLLWEGPFLVLISYQRSYLLLHDGEISYDCVSILVVLPTEWQSACQVESHTQTNTPICYWAWKSLRTLRQSCGHFISECSPSDFYELCKAIIFLVVIYCWKISHGIILIACASMELLSKTRVPHLHLIPTIQPYLQRLPHTLPHCITTTWKIPLNLQVQLQTICILIVIALLCTQLCVAVICYSKTKYASLNRTAIFFIVMCSLHLILAHPTQRETNLATLHNSAMQRHTRENGITSRTLTLRLTGGPNVGYCVTVAMGSLPQEVSQASAVTN